jgi:hypothetical protein
MPRKKKRIVNSKKKRKEKKRKEKERNEKAQNNQVIARRKSNGRRE